MSPSLFKSKCSFNRPQPSTLTCDVPGWVGALLCTGRPDRHHRPIDNTHTQPYQQFTPMSPRPDRYTMIGRSGEQPPHHVTHTYLHRSPLGQTSQMLGRTTEQFCSMPACGFLHFQMHCRSSKFRARESQNTTRVRRSSQCPNVWSYWHITVLIAEMLRGAWEPRVRRPNHPELMWRPPRRTMHIKFVRAEDSYSSA